jgi:hypothetical protein
MLRKLLSIYENSILFPQPPENPAKEMYLFYDEATNEWVGIPKSGVSERK